METQDAFGEVQVDKLGELLAAAAEHGLGSEPDHEVGDLQDILSSCWARMTKKAQEAVYAAHKELIDNWLTDEVRIRYEEQSAEDGSTVQDRRPYRTTRNH
jgi:hypothetical protein